jgi:TatD DNase family protein
MLIDTHCHLTFHDLSSQVDAVLERARHAGVRRVITVATTPTDAHSALDLMESHPQVFLVAGIHPHEAANVTRADLDALSALLRRPSSDHQAARRLVAVGETGLDLHYDFAAPGQQEELFRFHLELASETKRPVVIHAREAEERVCDVLAEYPALAERVVFHCFSGGREMARHVLDLGFWASYTGVVTFKNADTIRAGARLVPLDRMLIETDAPFLSPEPVRKQHPCEPAFIVHTARFLAELRGEPFETFAAQTTANAERFFNLPEEST